MTRSTPVDFARTRSEYAGALTKADLAPSWPVQFGQWLADAVAAGLYEPNAMVLATADEAGRPSARTVLLKSFDEWGLVFFTNYGSGKGRDLAENPQASAVFAWLPLHRQVIAGGAVQQVTRQETEEYFALRPRGAQLGAWASEQSTVLDSRAALDEAAAAVEERFAGMDAVPPPPHWGGYRIIPDTVEFWQGRPNRLHDRLRYRRVGGEWVVERLAP